MAIEFAGPMGGVPISVRLSDIQKKREVEKKREWTNEDIKVTPEPQDSYMKDEVRTPKMAEKFSKTEQQKARFDISQGLEGIISPDQFMAKKQIIVTDENSSVLSPSHIKGKSAGKAVSSAPASLMLDHKGNLIETKIPTDLGELKTKVGAKIWKAGKDPSKTATIGTFNIEWLGMKKRSEQDYKNIAKVIKDTGAQVLGIQEIAQLDGLRRVMKHLPNYGYILGKSGQQMVGVIFDKDRVKYDKNSIDQLTDVTLRKKGLRPPLKVYMKVDEFDFTFVVMHLKASFDERSMGIREKQAKEVNKWLKNQLQTEDDKDVIIVGDYNDFADSKALKNIDRGDTVDYMTQNFEKEGNYSHVRYKNVIDHLAVSNAEGGANEEAIPGSVRTIDENNYKDYKKGISDHKPVVFDVQSGVDRD